MNTERHNFCMQHDGACNCEDHRATCGGCNRSWCDLCDPAPSALCHYCNGTGKSSAPLGAEKTYYSQDNIGCAKYTVSFHNGEKLHDDGSPFFDMRIFRRKADRNKFVSDLTQQGYAED